MSISSRYGGGSRTEVVSGGKTQITVAASPQPYASRAATYRHIATSGASPKISVGPADKDLLHVRRGMLLFTDTLERSGAGGALTLAGSSQVQAFVSCAGMSATLDAGYVARNNAEIVAVAGGHVTDEEQQRLAKKALAERLRYLRFAGVASADCKIGHTGQGGEGVASTLRGMVTVLNTTGQEVWFGDRLSVEMPLWQGRGAPHGLGVGYVDQDEEVNHVSAVDFDTMPTLKLVGSGGGMPRKVPATHVVDLARKAEQLVRAVLSGIVGGNLDNAGSDAGAVNTAAGAVATALFGIVAEIRPGGGHGVAQNGVVPGLVKANTAAAVALAILGVAQYYNTDDFGITNFPRGAGITNNAAGRRFTLNAIRTRGLGGALALLAARYAFAFSLTTAHAVMRVGVTPDAGAKFRWQVASGVTPTTADHGREIVDGVIGPNEPPKTGLNAAGDDLDGTDTEWRARFGFDAARLHAALTQGVLGTYPTRSPLFAALPKAARAPNYKFAAPIMTVVRGGRENDYIDVLF